MSIKVIIQKKKNFSIPSYSGKVMFCKMCIEENNLTPEITVVLIFLVASSSFMKRCGINIGSSQL